MSRISEIIKLSPGYKSAINVGNDIDNYEKVSTYIPTETGSQCIEMAAKALNPECKERSFLITGTYGTGKSHLAIVLCNLLKIRGLSAHLNPVMEKISNKWQERFDEIIKYRRNIEDKPFLIVNLYQDEGRINDALLRGLDKALSSLGLHDLLPDTVFTAALKRINNIRSNHPDALKDLKKVIDEEGLVSIDDFERRLKNCEKEAFEIFLNIHPRFSHGAKFDHHQDMKAAEVYTATAKRLKEKGFAGIVVIWDEFGRYMERSLEEPKGNESLELQEFAEKCNDSYLHKEGIKLFTFLIAHREMQEYLGLVNAKISHWKSEEERKAFTVDIQKIQKRFHGEIRMKANDTEIFDLIDHVIVQQKDKPLWKDVMKKGVLDIWAEKCVNYRIFPEFDKTKILDTIVEGSYPLHPVTTCCLPKLSEKVAQNERTLFQFLCKDEPNSVSEFIRTPIEDEDGKLNIITLDLLMDYFKEEAKKSDKTKKVMHEYLNAERLLVSSPDIHRKIAKAIAVQNMASDDRVQLKNTPEFIAFALNENLETITEALEILSSRNAEQKILTKSSVDGTYRFYGAGTVDIGEEIEKIIKERDTTTNPIKILDWTESSDKETLWVKLGLPISIEPKSYNDDYKMNRAISFMPVDIKGLEGFRDIPNDGIQDGMLLVVLCESEPEIRKTNQLLSGDKFREPRLLIAINKQPMNFSYFVRKYDALLRLRYERKEIFGEGAPYEDEWENEYNDCIELLRKTFSPLFNPEKNLMEFYCKGEVKKGISSQGRLENLATEMMREAYPSTPLVLREELKKTDGNDTFKKHRKPVIDNIFRENGPLLLSNEANAPVKSVIDSILKANNILVRKHGTWVIEKPADGANMAKVWSIIEDFILSCKLPGKPASLLIQSLISPPFGIRRRSIPIIVAAALRKYVVRGNITIKEKELPFLKVDSDAIESVVANPEKYTIIYAEVGEGQRTIVDGMCKVYGVEISGELGEKIVALKEKLVSWWQGLSNYARKTIDVSEDAKVIREKVFVPLATEGADVNRIFFEKIPEAIGLDDLASMSYEKIKEKIYGKVKKVKEEFEKVTDDQKRKILSGFKEVFGSDKENDPIRALTNWHKELKEKGDVIINGDAGKLLIAIRQLKGKKDEGILIDLVTQITGNKPADWNSDTLLDELKGQLKNIKKTIEGNKTSVQMDKDSISISLTIDGRSITRQFKKTISISDNGKAMANMINEAISGIGRSLTEEERFTVLIEVLKEHLK